MLEGDFPDPFEARIGELIGGKWQLERLLGVGGMASVYAARHQRTTHAVALKILLPEVARITEARERFEQEARAITRLSHPNVLRVFDVDVSDAGEPYLVMELLEGESLQNRHDRVPVDAPTLLGFVDQLLDVLAIAHDAGIVHRDIKPDNLFIDKRAGLKVLDFGIARVRHATAMIVRTKTGSALGTPSYMPPEQMTGLDVDHRADIFAVGATMFELCAGRPIHVGDNPQMLVAKIMTEQAAPLASLAPQLSPHLCAVVDRALAFDAADRYPDARTMRADVRAVQAGSPPPYASAHAPVTPTIPQEPVFEAPRAPSAMLLSERQYRIIAICLGAAFVLLMAMFLLT